MTQFVGIDASQIPLALLLEADPSEQQIAQYSAGSICFALSQTSPDATQNIVAACLFNSPKNEPKNGTEQSENQNALELNTLPLHPRCKGRA